MLCLRLLVVFIRKAGSLDPMYSSDVEHDCFDDEAFWYGCCMESDQPYGDTKCWRTQTQDPSLWPELFLRCCLRRSFTREKRSVLMPDVFAGTLAELGMVQDMTVRVVKTGLRVASNSDAFSLPRNASVFVSVGSHGALEAEFVQALRWPRAVVFCFEPDPHSFHRLQMDVRRIVKGKVGLAALSRIFIFPVALGSALGLGLLQRGSYLDGECNSLLPVSSAGLSSLPSHATGCGVANLQPVNVLVLPLADVLKRLVPSSVEPRVALLKIDAQGMDLDVVRGGGHWIGTHVGELQMEVQDVPSGSDLLLYEGMHTKEDAVRTLAKLGFVLQECRYNVLEIKEQDCWFLNRRFQATFWREYAGRQRNVNGMSA